MSTKEAWPAEGIQHGTSIEDYTWGYLIQDGLNFIFDDSVRPNDEEIIRRWQFYLSPDRVLDHVLE